MLSGYALPFPKFQMFTTAGAVAANHRLAFFAAGTDVPQDTYADALLTTPNDNPLTLDAAGRGVVYLDPAFGGYKVEFLPPLGNNTPIWTQDVIYDPAGLWVARFGYELQVGARDVTDSYVVTDDDVMITVASTGGPNPCKIYLPPAITRGMPVIVKNMGTTALAVTPDNLDTIEEIGSAYTVAAAVSPNFPTAWFVPDRVSNWWVIAKFS